MNKFLIKISTGLLILFPFFSYTVFASFSDVPENNENFEAINYLQENQVINGYEDGTFKPEQNVNRAEFLKIIIEGSKIKPGINNPTPFKDVDHTAWYATYVKHAYASGWINGYPDGTFKPEQTINKVEALKILAKAQNWLINPIINEAPYSDTPTDAWYTPYVNFAKQAGYLEETNDIFEPSQDMQRGGISQIIYKTLIVKEAAELETKNDETPPSEVLSEIPKENEAPAIVEEIEASFTPTSYQVIPEDFFDNIILDEELPNTFYKNEVYVIKGTVTSTNTDKATVILNSKDGINKLSFSGDLSNKKFAIPVYFTKSGNYLLGLIPGETGTSTAVEISTLKELPAISNTAAPNSKPGSINISYQNDMTKVSIPNSTATLTKLIFSQDDRIVSYLSRQSLGEMVINYQDFESFNTQEVSYHIETAKLSSDKPIQISTQFTEGDIKKFNPIEHSFDFIDKTSVTSNPPDTLATPQSIKFTGTVKTKTKITAYMTKPDGFVDEMELTTGSPYSSDLIAINGDFSASYSISKTGRYIFEINNENGEATINHPIYVGNYIPLLPDFFDVHQKELFEGTFNLNDLRNNLLAEINTSRTEHGLNEVVLSEEISEVAQNHVEDMKTNNFFAHNNLQGETPEDRRIKAGIKTSVAENLSRDVDIPSVHYGLMRSGAHRKNILEKNWTRVGLGITEDQGYLLVAEEFSTSAVTESDLLSYRSELVTEVNKTRSENGKSTLNTTEALDATAKYLNDKNILENKNLTNEIFQEATSVNGIPGSSEAIGRIFDIWGDILQSILEEIATATDNESWKLMGVDIQLDNEGSIHTILIFNNPI